MSDFTTAMKVLVKHDICTKKNVGKLMEKFGFKDFEKLGCVAYRSDSKHFSGVMREVLTAHVIDNIDTVLKLETDTSVSKTLNELLVLKITDEATSERIGTVIHELPLKHVLSMCRVVNETKFRDILFEAVREKMIASKGSSTIDATYLKKLNSNGDKNIDTPAVSKTRLPRGKKTKFVRFQSQPRQQQPTETKKGIEQCLPFVSIVKILNIEKELEQFGYYDNGMPPPIVVHPGEILKGMENIGDRGLQRPRLKTRNEVLPYPFAFRITDEGKYAFYEWEGKRDKYIRFDVAQRKHIKYWEKSQKLMRLRRR